MELVDDCNFNSFWQVSDEGKLVGGKKGGLFYDVQQLSRIWNHPFILELAKQRRDEKEDENDEEGSLKDFICDDDEDIIDSGNEESDADSDIQVYFSCFTNMINCISYVQGGW